MSVEEAGGRLGYHDHPVGGNGRGGFDNSLDISQIEREAAEGQEVNLTFCRMEIYCFLSLFLDRQLIIQLMQIEPSTPGLPWASSLTSPLPLEQLLAQEDQNQGEAISEQGLMYLFQNIENWLHGHDPLSAGGSIVPDQTSHNSSLRILSEISDKRTCLHSHPTLAQCTCQH